MRAHVQPSQSICSNKCRMIVFRWRCQCDIWSHMSNSIQIRLHATPQMCNSLDVLGTHPKNDNRRQCCTNWKRSSHQNDDRFRWISRMLINTHSGKNIKRTHTHTSPFVTVFGVTNYSYDFRFRFPKSVNFLAVLFVFCSRPFNFHFSCEKLHQFLMSYIIPTDNYHS